ncbi:MAG: tetratricopeptide repeat protein [Planctomycetota bacterium]
MERPSSQSSRSRLFEVVHQNLEIRQYGRAHELIERALAEEPDAASLHALRALVFLRQSRPADAEAAAREALLLDPEETAATRVLARSTMLQGRNRESEAHFLELLRRDPTDVDALCGYAWLQNSVGELEKAELLVREALRIAPTDADAQNLLSIVQLARGSSKQATLSNQVGLRLSPDDEVSHLAAAAAAFERFQPFRARRHVREALRIDPENTDTQEAFHDIDKHCRWPFLLYYGFGKLCGKIPGGALSVWAAVVAFVFLSDSLGVPRAVVVGISLGYLGLCVYTWLASPLMKVWVRLFPARL